jgi:hypothetical protein
MLRHSFKTTTAVSKTRFTGSPPPVGRPTDRFCACPLTPRWLLMLTLDRTMIAKTAKEAVGIDHRQERSQVDTIRPRLLPNATWNCRALWAETDSIP